MLRNEFNLFLLALGFFTRLPLPAKIVYSPELLNHSTRYYGLVGAFIGLILCPILYAAGVLFPTPIAVILTITASLIITGAFHEDGLADMTDGFGGGFTPERKLEIMKDSRQGTYGVCAIVLTLGFYYVCLNELFQHGLCIAFTGIVCAHGLSRVLAGSFIADLSYLRALDSKAKAKPLSTGMRRLDFLILLLSALPLLALLNTYCAAGLVVLGIITHYLFRSYLLSQFGGYTGDCLGAIQVISMIITWLYLICLLKFNIDPLQFIFFQGLQ